jgi:hypothetical protein
MLASNPASILNHIRDEPGIPSDSEKISHALGEILTRGEILTWYALTGFAASGF